MLGMSLTTSSIYLLATMVNGYPLKQRLSLKAFQKIIILTAISLHGYLLYKWIDTPFGQNLSISNTFSFIIWLMAIFISVTTFLQKQNSLLILTMPMAALAAIVPYIFPGTSVFYNDLQTASLFHIFISFFAFSVLGTAALQAGLLLLQNYILKSKKIGRYNNLLHNLLPPRQKMQSYLFQILWTGFLLLSCSFFAATIFMHPQISISQISKIGITVVVWSIFATILYSHKKSGLPSEIVTTWTVFAVLILCVAYFGNKLW